MKLTPLGPLDVTRATGVWVYQLFGISSTHVWARWWAHAPTNMLNRTGLTLVWLISRRRRSVGVPE